jgi:four helix bundle protein
MTIPLEELEIYRIAERIADSIWEDCSGWGVFERETVGKQLVRSADSIGANIAEGYGRYSFRENVQCCYNARGSYMETQHWVRRARKRKLLNAGQNSNLDEMIHVLGPKLNAYINSIKAELRKSKSIANDAKPMTSDQ